MAIQQQGNGFFEGLEKGLYEPGGVIGSQLADIEGRRKMRLELMMKSKAIEMELAQKQQEINMSRFDPTLSAGLAKASNLEIPQDYGLLPQEGTVLGGLARTMEAGAAKSRTINRPTVKFVNVGNTVKMIVHDPSNEQEPIKMSQLGITPTAHRVFSEAEDDYKRLFEQINIYRNTLNRLMVSDNYISRQLRAGTMSLGYFMNTNNPDAQLLRRSREQLGVILGAMANKGRPTEPDALKAQKMLATEWDSPQTATALMNQLEDTMDAGRKSLYTTMVEGRLPTREEVFGKQGGLGGLGSVSSSEVAEWKARRGKK